MRFRIIAWLLRHFDFILIADAPYTDGTHEGCVIETLSSCHEKGEKDAIAGIMASCMENRPVVCETLMEGCLRHLKRYEVDSKNFVQKLYEK